MTAALHRDLAAVYERHGVTDMATDHWRIADAIDAVRAADAAAEAAVGCIPETDPSPLPAQQIRRRERPRGGALDST